MRAWARRAEWLALVILAVAAVAASMVWRQPNAFEGQPLVPPRQAPAFTLVDQHGRPFSSEQLRGKVTAVFFGYTYCPDVCPATVAMFARARQELARTSEADSVRFVFVSVDPERDTPERLARYLEPAGPDVIGLTGTPAQVEQVVAAWGVTAEKVPVSGGVPGAYTVAHTASVLLVDRSGRIRVQLPFGSTAEQLVHDIRQLLTEG
ncbi:MAG TPA: SCO family protein [Limnochordales bacterium]